LAVWNQQNGRGMSFCFPFRYDLLESAPMSRAVLTSGLVAGLLLLLLGCSALSAHSLIGNWGSNQAQLTLTARGGTFIAGCTQVNLSEPITLDSANHFDVAASYSFLPASLDPPGSARLVGDLTGDTLVLSIRFTDSGQRLGPLALKRDFPSTQPSCM
jgi:hypothetical protein